ncbi:MAG: hypothetical protein A3H96_11545 [Acidobacteria bacterium RIFCSPLOWO2_02_FULL_67_36]|nr:MAG: hypothetical protein A3H96_11545 [Acidobacteria bacterium RIFCSPLOWO2_02_FULL_67_36]
MIEVDHRGLRGARRVIELELDPRPELFADQRGEIRRDLEAERQAADPAGVDGMPQQLVEPLQVHAVAAPGAEAHRRQVLEQLAADHASGVPLERLTYDRTRRRVRHEARAGARVALEIADRRRPDPAAALDGRLHSGEDALGADVVVELRHRGEDAFHQPAGRRFVDRFGDRAQGDAEASQEADDRVMVGAVAREPGQRVDDDRVQVTGVLPAMLEQAEEFGAVRGLRAFAGVHEHLVDDVVVARAVLATGLLLCRETQVGGLLDGRDAAVDRGAHGGILHPRSRAEIIPEL